VSTATLPLTVGVNVNHTLLALPASVAVPGTHGAGVGSTGVVEVAVNCVVVWVVSSATRKGVAAGAITVAKLMLSFVAENACATMSVFGSDCTPPTVTEMAREPATAISVAGMEANS